MGGLAVRYRTQRNGSIVHVQMSRVVQLEVPPGKLWWMYWDFSHSSQGVYWQSYLESVVGSRSIRRLLRTHGIFTSRMAKRAWRFYEFLLWCIRLGYGLKQFNSKYYVDDDTKGYLIPEPVAYVPTDWVGRPQKWFEVSNNDFRHFHWMQRPVHEWNRRIVPESELRDISRKNMEHCCVCYGSPPAGKEFLICECR
jgi:hypothetical protein